VAIIKVCLAESSGYSW